VVESFDKLEVPEEDRVFQQDNDPKLVLLQLWLMVAKASSRASYKYSQAEPEKLSCPF
jgi:hypothetical protein